MSLVAPSVLSGPPSLRTPRRLVVTLALALVALFVDADPAAAGLSRRDRRAAEQTLRAGDLYLRVDAPCTKGVHSWGVFLVPLVEVSPRGATSDFAAIASVGWHHAAGTFWAARINDHVRLAELEWDGEEGSVEIELEGIGRSEGQDTALRFVGIHTLADFAAAFAHAFAPRPLQEEHPEWPQEVRTAIAERRLLDGMTQEQAYLVVGAPAAVEKRDEGGVAVETWELQPDGLDVRLLGLAEAAPPGGSLRFEDGALVDGLTLGGSETLELDAH